MEPVSSRSRPESESVESTAAEVEAGACLPREPEPLASRASDEPPRPPAVAALVDKHPPPASTNPAQPSPSLLPSPAPSLPSPLPPASAGSDKVGKGPHPGFALGVGVNLARPGKSTAGEVSLGLVVDLGEPSVSLFTSEGSGTASALGVSAGLSGQVTLLGDARRFEGSGQELGVNLARGGASLDFSSEVPGGPIEFNGATVSFGPSIGRDGHYFDTTTQVWSASELAQAAVHGVHDIQEALRRISQLPGPRRFGP